MSNEWSFRGEWEVGTEYLAGDVVKHQGFAYVSDGTQDPGPPSSTANPHYVLPGWARIYDGRG